MSHIEEIDVLSRDYGIHDKVYQSKLKVIMFIVLESNGEIYNVNYVATVKYVFHHNLKQTQSLNRFNLER